MLDWILEIIQKVLPYVPALYQKLFFQKIAIDRLYDVLNRYYVTSKIELEYQIEYYVPQKFESANGEILTMRELAKQIKISKGDFFTIYGKPASGKSTAMRKLYCILWKTHKCVYFQMKNIRNLEHLKECLGHQKKDSNLKDRERVIAFFDGVDEAIPFWNGEDFFSIFLNGTDAKIFSVFEDCGLVADNMIFGMRPEFLKNSVSDLKLAKENFTMINLEIMRMSDKDIIKVYKSLKGLKKKEKGLLKEKQRHQSRYPEKKEGKYIRLLKRILKSNPNSIFHYPMYIRYVYAYMQEYEKQWNPYMQDIVSDTDKACAFDVLVRAVSKWEFHVYYQDSSEEKPDIWINFYNIMKNCMDGIIEVMMEQGQQNVITHEQLQKILNQYCLETINETKTAGNDEGPMMLVISHCFMVSDKTGEKFEFCHLTLFEYFLARYLFRKADFSARKQFLCNEKVSENLRQVYYGIFCTEKKELREKIVLSIRNLGKKGISYNDFMELGKQGLLQVVDEPFVPIAQIYEYLPEIKGFSYRDNDFAEEFLEQMCVHKTLDIRSTAWDSLQYAEGLIAPGFVTELNISGLRFGDIERLGEYSNLKRLHMCECGADYDAYIREALPAIKNIPLDWLYLYSEDGCLCEQIYDLLEKRDFCSENVFWYLPDYSVAHVKLYHLKQKAEQNGQPFRFYVNNRTSLQGAMSEYKKSNNNKNPDILKAVFELEADENGVLGLKEKDPEATYWTGIALAEYYYNEDFLDEDRKIYQIYCRLEPFIKKDGSQLSAFYGRGFGEYLCTIWEYKKSKEWLVYAASPAVKHYFSEEDAIEIKLKLYKTLVMKKEKDPNIIYQDLKERIEKLPDYQKNWRYLNFIGLNNAFLISNWKKGEKPPQNLWEQHQEYLDLAKSQHDRRHLVMAIHRSAIISNRLEDVEKGASFLEELSEAIKDCEKCATKRGKQADWIRFHEQKLYHLFLTGQKEEAVEVADELVGYPHWPSAKRTDDYLYIRDMCMKNAWENEAVDKHRLWGRLWY